jgi:hypothetical protein
MFYGLSEARVFKFNTIIPCANMETIYFDFIARRSERARREKQLRLELAKGLVVIHHRHGKHKSDKKV